MDGMGWNGMGRAGVIKPPKICIYIHVLLSAVLLCLNCCLFDLACIFLPSHLSLKHVHAHIRNGFSQEQLQCCTVCSSHPDLLP